ncbi:hypothetical protein [Chthonomonas calidirosea]|uniref:hypothetical protein n=1 Tax=Chthonomonas calidirosea TaxID=454171 RepID=UPI0006ECAA0C|nr:hypothetical protein [Chthonomonas calidirosea]CEK15090.1 O-antigen ligase like membrane protein [Chthonomonas calidirosea]
MIQTPFALRTKQPDSADSSVQLGGLVFVLIVGFFLPAALLPFHFARQLTREQDGYAFTLIPHTAWGFCLLGSVALLGWYSRARSAKLGLVNASAICLCIYMFLFCATPSPFLAGWSLFFLSQCLQGRERQLTLTTLKVLLALHVVIAYIAYALHFHQFHSPYVGYRASGLYGTPFELTPHMLVFFFILLAELLQHPPSWRTPWRLNAPFFVLVLLLLTYTRGCYVGLAAGLGCIALFQSRPRRYVLLLSAAVLIIGCFWLRSDKHISTQRLLHDNSTRTRISDWFSGLESSLSNYPWLGANALVHPSDLSNGAGIHTLISRAFDRWLEAGAQQFSDNYNIIVDYNLCIGFLHGYGAVGLTLFLLLVLALFYWLGQQLQSPDLPLTQNGLALATLGAWTALIVTSLFDPSVFLDINLYAGLISLLLLTGLALSRRFDVIVSKSPSAV